MPSKASSTIPGKVYKYVHHQNVFIKTNLTGREYNNPWLQIDTDGTITIKASERPYAWDGCSPKWNFIDLTFGTPDGKLDYKTEKAITYYSSMIHDVLYQFKNEIPISRKETDVLFKLNLAKAGFLLTPLYYAGVRLGGGFFGKWKTTGAVEEVQITAWSW